MPAISATTNMSNHSDALVLNTEERGTKLSFGLYDFSMNVSSATGDVDRLAKQVVLVSLGLRQAGVNLKNYGSLPSAEAWNDVSRISILCQEVFEEIERMVPVHQLQDAKGTGSFGSDMALATKLRNALDWNALAKSKALYLLEHLESLKLTLSVMSQTLYTANSIAWSRRERNQASDNAVYIQRLQLETLIIEQQLSLLRTCRQFDQFRYKVENAPLAVTHSASPQSLELIRRDDGPNPEALISYQEPSLLQIHQPQSDIDDLARVRSVSRSFVDSLLNRWTSLPGIIDGFRNIDLIGNPRDGEAVKCIDIVPPRDQANMGRLVRRNSNYQPAVAESDIDSEDENARRRPKLRLSTAEPVLEEVDEPLPPIGLGVAVPAGDNLLSPLHAQSWSAGAGSYFPSAHGHSRPRRSPHPSPFSSPRPSFSSINSPQPSFSSTSGSTNGSISGSPASSVISGSLPNRPITAFRSDSIPFPPPPSQAVQPPQSPQQPTGIPWRVRVNQEYWDYRDAVQVNSNTRMEPRTAMKDFKAFTEIMSDYVTREAVKERGFDFQRIRKPVDVRSSNGKMKTEMLSCLCINGALGFNDIKDLVKRTEEIRAEEELMEQRRRMRDQMPRSPRDSGERFGSQSQREEPLQSPRDSGERFGGGAVRPPPHLERSQTSPLLRSSQQPAPAHGYTANYRYSPRTSPSNSNSSITSDSDNNSHVPRHRDSAPTTSTSRHRRNSSVSSRRDTYPRSPSRSDSGTIRERRDSSSHRDKSTSRRDSSTSSRKRERRDSHRGTVSGKLFTRAAAGLGLATLLDGLPEVLSYL